jgi:hypothetical protein
MSARYPAWQCIGCGRIDGPQPCIGICRDRKVELVDAAELDRAQARIAELETLLHVLAHTTPHADAWERSWRQLQERARAVLKA